MEVAQTLKTTLRKKYSTIGGVSVPNATMQSPKPLYAITKQKWSAKAKGLTTQSERNKIKKVEFRTHSKKRGVF